MIYRLDCPNNCVKVEVKGKTRKCIEERVLKDKRMLECPKCGSKLQESWNDEAEADD